MSERIEESDGPRLGYLRLVGLANVTHTFSLARWLSKRDRKWPADRVVPEYKEAQVIGEVVAGFIACFKCRHREIRFEYTSLEFCEQPGKSGQLVTGRRCP